MRNINDLGDHQLPMTAECFMRRYYKFDGCRYCKSEDYHLCPDYVPLNSSEMTQDCVFPEHPRIIPIRYIQQLKGGENGNNKR